MPSCMSNYRFVRARISILVSKKIYCTSRLLEADPAGQPGTDLEITHNMPSCMSKYRYVRFRISFLVPKIIYCTWRPLEAGPGGQPGTDWEVTHNMPLCMSKYSLWVCKVRISYLVS